MKNSTFFKPTWGTSDQMDTTILSRGANNLGQRSAEHWRTFYEALRNSQVQTLDLAGNNLNQMNAEQWEAFREAFQNSQPNEPHSLRGHELNQVLECMKLF